MDKRCKAIATKKPYKKPALVVYGGVETLTRGILSMGKMDGAPMSGLGKT